MSKENATRLGVLAAVAIAFAVVLLSVGRTPSDAPRVDTESAGSASSGPELPVAEPKAQDDRSPLEATLPTDPDAGRDDGAAHVEPLAEDEQAEHPDWMTCPPDLRADFEYTCTLTSRAGRPISESTRLPHELWQRVRPVVEAAAEKARNLDRERMESVSRVLAARKARGDLVKFPNPRTVGDAAERERIENELAELRRKGEDPLITAVRGGDATHSWVVLIHAEDDGALRVAYQDIDRLAREVTADLAVLLYPVINLQEEKRR